MTYLAQHYEYVRQKHVKWISHVYPWEYVKYADKYDHMAHPKYIFEFARTLYVSETQYKHKISICSSCKFKYVFQICHAVIFISIFNIFLWIYIADLFHMLLSYIFIILGKICQAHIMKN